MKTSLFFTKNPLPLQRLSNERRCFFKKKVTKENYKTVLSLSCPITSMTGRDGQDN